MLKFDNEFIKVKFILNYFRKVIYYKTDIFEK